MLTTNVLHMYIVHCTSLSLQIKFEYIPTTHEYIEALWEFSIPSLSITIPFLLVGQTQEPKVNLDRAYLSFRSMLIGKRRLREREKERERERKDERREPHIELQYMYSKGR